MAADIAMSFEGASRLAPVLVAGSVVLFGVSRTISALTFFGLSLFTAAKAAFSVAALLAGVSRTASLVAVIVLTAMLWTSSPKTSSRVVTASLALACAAALVPTASAVPSPQLGGIVPFLGGVVADEILEGIEGRNRFNRPYSGFNGRYNGGFNNGYNNGGFGLTNSYTPIGFNGYNNGFNNGFARFKR